MTAREPDSAEQAFRARDAYQSAVAQALLLLLWWAAVESHGLPLPRPISGLLHGTAVLGICSLAYLCATWRRPRLSVAVALSLTEILLVAVLIAWSGWKLVPQGRTWEPVAAAQLSIASIPLVAPPFLAAGMALVVLFSLEVTAIVVAPHLLGLGPLPPAEPYASLSIAIVAVGVLVMRERRRQLGLGYIRAQAEATALSRLSPLFVAASEKLNEHLTGIQRILNRLGEHRPPLIRAVERLASLQGRIEPLAIARDDQQGSPILDPGTTSEAERFLLARDSQVGALIFAAGALVLTFVVLWGLRSYSLGSTLPLHRCVAAVYAAVVVWMLVTWHRPLARRGLLASLLLFSVGAFVPAYVSPHWAALGPTAFPFVGYKLLLIALVVIRPIRLWLGLVWLSLLTIESLTPQFVIAPAAHLPPLEPWHTLSFALVALGLFLMGEQRRVASIALLRAEVQASSLRRRANLHLALNDQMNTPLQTLMVLLAVHERQLPRKDASELRAHVDELRALSKQLQQLGGELPGELQRLSLDAADVLRTPE